MGRNVEEIEQEILEATAPGFRERILARGQARSLIWRNGKLPLGAPKFSQQLSYDLLSYGYSLLSHGLRLLEEDNGNRDIARRGFEFAAGAIESVVTNDSDSPERDFHRFIAAASYHLGRFSARAYSMLHVGFDSLHLSQMERCLSQIMLRRLDGLEKMLNEWHIEGNGNDVALAESLSEFLQDDIVENNDPEDTPSISENLINHVDLALTDHFLRAMSTANLALERGERRLLWRTLGMLQTGLDVCAELNMVPQWWCHRIAIHLIDDLWSSSFHNRLPPSFSESESSNWSQLRTIFIASLMRRSRAEIELWPSQLDAADLAINSSNNMVISLPTSAGKTRIAELCILKCLADRKRVVFVTPLRALSAQTEVVLQRTFAPLGKTVTSLYGSIGASDADKNVLKNRNIIVATPEKLDFALRNDPSLLDDVGLVVLDEGHMIGRGEREVRYEVQIQRLLKRDDADQRRIVCLSAVLPEGEKLVDFVGWLTNDEIDGLVKTDWQPTNIRYGEILWQKNHGRLNIEVGEEKAFVEKFIVSRLPTRGKRQNPFPNNQQELCLATAWRLVEDGQTVLIFCPLKKSVAAFAKSIVKLHKQGFLEPLLEDEGTLLESALTIGEEWFGQDHALLECLKLGVAIHHGALPTPYRREIERLLRDGTLKVTVSSPTLAQGLNLSATALVMFSLHRGTQMIKSSEFRNIRGRAGRAFVDLSGLVLHTIYDKHTYRLRNWHRFIENDSGQNVESGLFRLLLVLLERLEQKINPNSVEEMIDYIANNTGAWKFSNLPEENENTAALEAKNWHKNLSHLDTAVLALLGEHEVENDKIEETIDIIMKSSLFERTLARKNNECHSLFRTGLTERTRYIWSQTTAAQRKGYFLAGVGLETGKQLDAHASDLNWLLIQANAAILNDNMDLAIEAISEFAEIIFTVPAFEPDSLPKNWQSILTAWLKGESIATFTEKKDNEVFQFIEQAVVYRLAWGMDAVRVRGLANDDLISEDELKMSDYELDYAVAAVETGTLNRSATLLMQSGFGSRSAAIRIAQEEFLDFGDYRDLGRWLRSEEVACFSDDVNWPTPQTHDLWVSFVKNSSTPTQSKWREQKYSPRIRWNNKNRPAPESALKIITKSKGKSTVLNAQRDYLGKLKKKLNPSRKGLLLATATDAADRIQMIYYGPNDLFYEQN